MATSLATAGFGTLLKRGDGGVGAGTQASKTIGTSNQQLRVKARTAGTAGNSKTFGIVVSGNNTAYSQVITATSVLINSATDGAGNATTTVLGAIAQLALNTTFVDNFQADVGSGNGSGVLINGSAAVLSGGTDGTEVFTTISEVKSIGGPKLTQETIETTHMESPNSYKEYLASLLDAGEMSFDVNFTNVAAQTNVILDLENRTKRNFQLVFSTAAGNVTFSFAAFVTNFEFNFAIQEAISASVTLKITGPVSRA